MPSLSEVLEFRKQRFAASMALIEKKGHDYNRQQQKEGDTLFNLSVCEILGIVPTTEQGILVRLSDKLMRLISLTAPGVDPANVEESVLDTINDVHNYIDYLGLKWLLRRAKNEASRLEVKNHAMVAEGPVQYDPGKAIANDKLGSVSAGRFDRIGQLKGRE